jgi:hypothetical protein
MELGVDAPAPHGVEVIVLAEFDYLTMFDSMRNHFRTE